MDFDKPKVYGDTFISDGLVYVVRIVWLFYGGKLPGKIFVYVRTFSEYKTGIYVGESFSLLDTEQRNEITFPSDTKIPFLGNSYH